jgi:hypothetical protein
MTCGIQEWMARWMDSPLSDWNRMLPLRTDHKQRMASLKLHITRG